MQSNSHNSLPLPELGLVRLPTILQHFQISRGGWYAGVKTGLYPRPIKIGSKSFWNAKDIHNLISDFSNRGD